jgi:hypothetical protein
LTEFIQESNICTNRRSVDNNKNDYFIRFACVLCVVLRFFFSDHNINCVMIQNKENYTNLFVNKSLKNKTKKSHFKIKNKQYNNITIAN